MPAKAPKTQYAQAGDVAIAYQVIGDGPIDLVLFPGWFSHMDLQWTSPLMAEFNRRLASFSRLIMFDKRGVGLSDPVSSAPTLDERMDDIRVVMDAVGSESAAIFGLSEGGTMSALFAAAYPERVRALVIYEAWAAGPSIVLDEQLPGWRDVAETLGQVDDAAAHWGEGRMVQIMAPSVASHPEALEFMAAFERASLSRRMALDLWEAINHHDARAALPLIRAPTLVAHRHGRAIPSEHAPYLASLIPGAQLIELPGEDHFPWVGDMDSVANAVEEFVSGVRRPPKPDRVLATVLFTDIVGATQHVVGAGDSRWRRMLADHDARVRRELERYDGREIKHTGDGFLVTFTGPARAVSCACAIRDSIADLGLEIRAGVHTGECELDGDDVRGVAVHIGSRVADRAQPGEVLVSRTVRDLMYGADVEFGDRGAHELKGLPGAWELYRVERTSSR